MTLHWTIISHESTQEFFCPISIDPNLQETQTFVKMADIYCYGELYDKLE